MRLHRTGVSMQPTMHLTNMHYHSNCRLNNTRHESIPIQAAALNSHTAKPLCERACFNWGCATENLSSAPTALLQQCKHYPKKNRAC